MGETDLIKNEKWRELPKPLDTGQLTEDFAVRNSSYIRQADMFRKLAIGAPLETRPILVYYSAIQLYAFLMGSLLGFEKPRRHHGLYMERGGSLDSLECTIDRAGFFQRIADTYALLGCRTMYSPLLPLHEKKSFVVADSSFSYEKKPKMKVREICEVFHSGESSSEVPSRDLSSLLLLYVASNLTRYYPDAWFKISSGIETDLMYFFEEAFRNYEWLFQRVLGAFRALTLQSQPKLHLQSDNDMMRRNAGRFIFPQANYLW